MNGKESVQNGPDSRVNAAAPPNNTGSSMGQQLDQLVSLIEARSRGEIGNATVESAVSGLLSKTSRTTPQIDQDTDDYDNFDDEPDDKKAAAAPAGSTGKKWTDTPPTMESLRKPQDEDENDPYDDIPLGKDGAKMMVTFGDGHHPKPEAVSAALLGARACLQVAIKDARALRRQTKEEYLRARKVVQLGKNKKVRLDPEDFEKDHVDPNMLYRAMAGYDRLAYDPKCGFDNDQLQQLFPEEMNAYRRWDKMHRSYEENTKEEAGAVAEKKDEDDEPEEGSNKDNDIKLTGGHLEERAAQFDVRTELMKDDWYLQFSEVRQGSFLGRRRGQLSNDDKLFQKQSKGKGSWESASPSSVRFLHWLGFDPRSALPPPNEATTQALAFLGHDFMGKIIEKAIYLRNVANHKKAENSSNDKNMLLELDANEHLEAKDIENALNDPDVSPAPLYSCSNGDSRKQIAAQLYFGPGFEDRLEMEMEAMVSGTKKRKMLSKEEQDIRRKEEEIFSEIEKPPVLLGNLSHILHKDNETKKTDGVDTKGE